MVTLTNVGTVYDTTDASKGLGIQRIDFTGIASVIFDVYVRKVGTGAQSWQLWNVTDASEIGVITDSGAVAERTLSATFAVALSGTRVVRVRAKSTNGADDPIYYSSSVFLVPA